MKVGIITMVSDNYGNRLQNYALQEVLLELGNNVETLHNPWNDKEGSRSNCILSITKKIIFFITKKPERYGRRIKFDYFNKKNIYFSKFWINKTQDKKIASSYYDLFICGSDQVWNSEAKEITGKYFADFAESKKRASYAASFGIDDVIESRKEEFSSYLNGMKYISVREERGIKIVKDLTGKKAIQHIDPTLLLTAEKWEEIATKSLVPYEKYIFCYFLGKPSTNLLNKLKEYQIKNNINTFILCNDLNSMGNNVGPSDFIALIQNAEFILTDSFHGTVFSILFHKPFFTYSRNGVKKNMDSRITSLLNLLKLNNRFENYEFDMKEIYDIDFTEAISILNLEREKAINYLKMITSDK